MCLNLIDMQGFGIAVMVSIALYEIVGILCFVFIKGKADNFFVAGRTMPIWVSVSSDNNASL